MRLGWSVRLGLVRRACGPHLRMRQSTANALEPGGLKPRDRPANRTLPGHPRMARADGRDAVSGSQARAGTGRCRAAGLLRRHGRSALETRSHSLERPRSGGRAGRVRLRQLLLCPYVVEGQRRIDALDRQPDGAARTRITCTSNSRAARSTGCATKWPSGNRAACGLGPSAASRWLQRARNNFALAADASSTIRCSRRLRPTVRCGQSLDGIELLCAVATSVQVLAARHQQAGKLSTLSGVNLGNTRPSDTTDQQRLAQAFNTVQVPLRWRDIEAREGHAIYRWPTRRSSGPAPPASNLRRAAADDRQAVAPRLDVPVRRGRRR